MSEVQPPHARLRRPADPAVTDPDAGRPRLPADQGQPPVPGQSDVAQRPAV